MFIQAKLLFVCVWIRQQTVDISLLLQLFDMKLNYTFSDCERFGYP